MSHHTPTERHAGFLFGLATSATLLVGTAAGLAARSQANHDPQDHDPQDKPATTRPHPAPSHAPNTALDLAALMKQAGDALDRKEYQAALDPLKTVTKAAPATAEAWYYLGYAYRGLNRNADAREAYEQAVRLKPDLYPAQLNLGALLMAMNDARAAVPHFEKAAALKPSDGQIHLDLGLALKASGGSSAAETELRRALQLDPKLDLAAVGAGQAELDKKDYRDAATNFSKALAINPGRAEADLGLASASVGLGQVPEAAQYFEEYLKLQPADAPVRFHLARLYLGQNKFEPALINLKQLEAAHAALPGLDAALGDAYALAGKFSDSESYYRRALASFPRDEDLADLHRALAATLLKENMAAGAESEFRQALRLDPKSTDAVRGLASSLYLEGRYAEAAGIIDRLVQSPAAPAGLYFILATCYDHLRDRPKAFEAYQEFLKRSNGASPDQEWQARQRAKLLGRELGKPL